MIRELIEAANRGDENATPRLLVWCAAYGPLAHNHRAMAERHAELAVAAFDMTLANDAPAKKARKPTV